MNRLLVGPAWLATSALLLAVAACGDEPRQRAEDPAAPTAPPSSAGTSAPTTGQTAAAGAPEVVSIVSGSAADGEVAEQATVLEEDGALARYVKQFDSPSFVADLTGAVESLPLAPGRLAAVAVISIGCDVPPSASVVEDDGAFLVSPGKIVAPPRQCYVPVTSVAVLDVPDL